MGDACQTSTSAPIIGLPSWSRTQPLKKRDGPGVEDRRREPPFADLGECALQKGPSKFAELSIAALSPLLRRQTSVDRPSDPAMSLVSLWLSVVHCPSADTIWMARSNSFSVSLASRTKACKCRTKHSRITFVRAFGVRLISSITASVTCCSLSIIMSFHFLWRDSISGMKRFLSPQSECESHSRHAQRNSNAEESEFSWPARRYILSQREIGAGGETRTHDLGIMRPSLYP